MTAAFACSQESSGPSELAAGPPAEVRIVGGNDQFGVVGQELADPLVVLVVDAKSKPVQGQIINFVVTQGGGSVFAGAAITNKVGEARERWTLGTSTAAEQRVEARAVDSETGAALVFGTFSATALPGPAAALEFSVQPDTAEEDAVITPAVKVSMKDSHGNAALTATDSVFMAITSQTGTFGAVLGGAVRQKAVAGVATFADLTIDQPASHYMLTATGVGLTSVTSHSFAINDVVPPPGPIARVGVQPISFGIEVGDTVTLEATAYDAANVAVPAATATWVVPTAAVSIAPDGTKGLLTGVARGGGPLKATIDGVTNPGGGGVSVYTPALMDSVSFLAAGWNETTLALGATHCTWLATFDPSNETAALRWVPGTGNAAMIEITHVPGSLPEYWCFRALQQGVVNVTGTFAGKTITKQLMIP